MDGSTRTKGGGMIYRWVGGPMDGAQVDLGEAENQRATGGQIGQFLWHGPDPLDPFNKIITYGLFRTENENVREYRYDQGLTDRANEFVMAKRKVAEN